MVHLDRIAKQFGPQVVFRDLSWRIPGGARFGLVGRSALDIRLEAFNLFNHTNFQTPNGNRSAASFGTITSAFPARQLQLGVKFYF